MSDDDVLRNHLWVEKYRPKTIAECVLPQQLATTLQKFVDDGFVPNILLSGPPGVGKTTVARAMLEQVESDYLIINGSLYGNIDTLRTDIMSFASTTSLRGARKYVILDEADYLNPNSTQPALRNFIEEYSANCGFVFTCNYRNRIIPALHSRCAVIEFKIEKIDKTAIAVSFMNRLCYVLDSETVTYDKKVLAELITKHFPDWRRVINESQRYAASTGRIDEGILGQVRDVETSDLVRYLREKNFSAMRKWCAQNTSVDTITLFRRLYDQSYDVLESSSVPQFVVLLNEHQYKAAFVADQEINLVAFLTSVMADCRFKS